MATLEDHPARYALTGELHARPFPRLSTRGTAVFLVLRPAGDASDRDRAADLAHLRRLLDHYGAPRPDPDATHYHGPLGRYQIKWEQHTEIVTYTIFSDAQGDRPFAPAEFDVFPSDWLAETPGERITSALIRVVPHPGPAEEVHDALSDWFVGESLAVARVLDDAAVIASDFRIDPAGHLRMAVFASPETGERRIGRIVQRLCEIETYKAMSMLGFVELRAAMPQINQLDKRLTELMTGMQGPAQGAEDTLHALLDVSVALETLQARLAFRFGATDAYEAIVYQRIGALREARFMGRQGFGEFMMRRYEPAMRTVKSTERRLGSMAARAIRASELLRTRVDVERSAQNQQILASMDRRSDLQLRLQHTVEGLSVVAISYYAVSLATYLLYPLADTLGLAKGVLTAVITLPVVGLVWLMLRRLRSRLG